ncbi:MAG: ATP-binding protein [Acidobacteriota bacterium]
MTTAITRVKIVYEQDVVYARQRARLLAEVLGYDMNDQTRISTAVSEIARNAYQYAGEGDVEFLLDGTSRPRGFLIVIRDHGPGIRDLEKIMEGRYVSRTGMGSGITGTRRLMDAFRIETESGKGTSVFLTKHLPPSAPDVTPAFLHRIADMLASHTTESPLEEIRVQNQELLRTLDELSRQRRELEDTNRGVLALYAELDEKVIQLQGIDRVKSGFLSNMSHEFRTPLNSILALSQLLIDRADGELTAEQERQVEFIRQAASDLYSLVNGLLDLAKIEAGKMNIHARDCSVEEIFSGLRGMLKPMLTNSAVELIFDPAGSLPRIFTDDGKVSQILRNFLSNALKFTLSGSIRVSARLSRDASMVEFSVEDTGIGIAEENLERIFDEYAQVESAQLGTPKGTGLGLPISRRLAELLGGRVEVRSVFGTGSTFTAVIPAHYHAPETEAHIRQLAPSFPPSQPLEPPSAPVHYRMKPVEREWLLDALGSLDRRSPLGKVLIIDDEYPIRRLFKGHLSDTDYTVVEAADGATGLSLAKDERPDVIILDLVMPDMNGFEVLRRLKNDPDTRSIPIIICTSKSLDEAEKNILRRLSADMPASGRMNINPDQL